MKISKLLVVALFAVLFLGSCSDDDSETNANFALDLKGLQDLGDNYQYENWLIVGGQAVSAGTFTVKSDGSLSNTQFNLPKEYVLQATKYVLTIEPKPDSDPTPSKVHVLAGDFNGNTADVSVGHADALGNDFTSATGKFIIATPTNGPDSDDFSGVWFLDPTNAPPAAPSLNLPTLPDGWEYEGWAVIDGKPVTTGKFTSVSGADQFGGFSGPNPAPPFPGEDFLMNAPSGFTFPTDLKGKKIVVSVEPKPDNSPAPFAMKPLVGDVPESATPGTLYPMGNNAAASNPSGKITR